MQETTFPSTLLRCIFATLCLLAAGMEPAMAAVTEKPDEPPSVPDAFVVKLTPDAVGSLDPPGRLFALRHRHGVRRMRPLLPPRGEGPRRPAGLDGLYRVELESAEALASALADFAAHPDVAYAEPIVFYESLADDPFLATSGSWGQPYADLWGLHLIRAPSIWTFVSGQGVVVAVIDSGSDLNHPDLAANLWRNPDEVDGNGLDDDGNGLDDDVFGWDFTNDDADPQDDNGHGTHVAGTIAAVADNGLGIAGVAPNASIMSLKGLDHMGRGASDDLARAILYAVDEGADVINMSWGGTTESQAVSDALAAAHAAGVVMVAAAGNSNRDAATFHPASSRHVITVGSIDENQEKSDFSNFGSSIDVVAPGGGSFDGSAGALYNNVLSLRSSTIAAGGITDPDLIVADDYLRIRGTSMAAPHVAGVVATVLERVPDATPEQVRQILRQATIDVGAPGWDPLTGHGRTDVIWAFLTNSNVEARLFAPRPGTYAADVIDIVGTVNGVFRFWVVQAEGQTPTSFNQLAEHTTPHEGALLHTWNTTDAVDTVHTLAVVDSATSRVLDRVLVTLDRVHLNLERSAFRAGDAISFSGWAAGGAFVSYRLEHRQRGTSVWSSDGISLVGGGLTRIRDGLLGTWDTSAVTEAGRHEVRLVVERNGYPELIEQDEVIVDPTIHAGWPRSYESLSIPGIRVAPFDQINAADLDGDGADELLFAYLAEAGVYRGDGSFLPGWPRDSGGPSLRGLLPADLDGNGELEIVAAGGSATFAWHRDGRTYTTNFPAAHYLSVRDFDGDGSDELVVIQNASIQVVDGQGRPLPGWPKAVGLGGLLRPVTGDLDGDGTFEVLVIQQFPGEIFAFHHDGTPVAGWPVSLGDNTVEFNPRLALADLDEDGRLEVVVGNRECRIFVFEDDGTAMPGWPIDIADANTCGAVALADLDGDQRPEVLAGGNSAVTIFTADGTQLPGWPQASTSLGIAVAADLDGDGSRDVVTEQRASSAGDTIAAFDALGRPLAGFPKMWSDDGSVWSSPAVADFDGDGLWELGAAHAAGEIYVWDLDGPATGDGRDWPMFDQNPHRTGSLDLAVTPPPPSDLPTLRIPTAIPALAQGTVPVPVALATAGADVASLAFSIDFDESCLTFDPTDSDGDGLPETVTFDLPPGFSAGASVDLGDRDGEIDVLVFDPVPPLSVLPDGTVATVELTATCTPSGTSTIVPVLFSRAPEPSFGDTAGRSLPGLFVDGSVEILAGLRGDCNGDGRVDAGDLSACGLEIFDGDGDHWLDAENGSFPGQPTGCDANGDTRIDAGDVSCKGLLIFDAAAACGQAASAAVQVPRLKVADRSAGADGRAVVPVTLSGDAAVNTVAFRLVLDPALAFDPTDADLDGIPDAVHLAVSASLATVRYDASLHALDVLMARLGSNPTPLPSGRLIEITLSLMAGAARGALTFADDPAASFGDVNGGSVAGTAEGGTVTSSDVQVFANGFESGDLSDWTVRP